jgi:hypothetical protein
MGKIPSEVPPAINKHQDFPHHRWFDIELQAPVWWQREHTRHRPPCPLFAARRRRWSQRR